MTRENFITLVDEERLSKMSFKHVVAEMAKGKTYQDLLGLEDETMQQFYEIACSYMEEKHYAEAADCFLFLLALNPLETNLWIKAGRAAQELQEYEQALEAYSMAMLCDVDDIFPHLYSAQIYILLSKPTQAQDCLEVCQKLFEEYPQYESLNKIIDQLKKQIQKLR